MHSQFFGFVLQMLRVLAVFRGPILLTADACGLAVFRDSLLLWILPVLQVYRDYVLRVLPSIGSISSVGSVGTASARNTKILRSMK